MFFSHFMLCYFQGTGMELVKGQSVPPNTGQKQNKSLNKTFEEIEDVAQQVKCFKYISIIYAQTTDTFNQYCHEYKYIIKMTILS